MGVGVTRLLCLRVYLPLALLCILPLGSFCRFAQAFCKILEEGGDVTPSGDDGLAALKMAMACDLSLKEGRPVNMSEITA